MQDHDLYNLLNRAAAAIETPLDLSDDDKKNLVEDLLVMAAKYKEDA